MEWNGEEEKQKESFLSAQPSSFHFHFDISALNALHYSSSSQAQLLLPVRYSYA
jgi:hypothetical protein